MATDDNARALASSADDADLLQEAIRGAHERQIAKLLHTYCRALDRRDRPLLESVFHPDSTHEMGGFKGTSRDFCGFAFDTLAILETTHHHLGNVLIELTGEEQAVAESYFVAYHRILGTQSGGEIFPDHRLGIDEDLFIAGRYLDRLERRSGVWKISHRAGVLDWARWEVADARGFPAPGGGPFGARDRSDPVYRFF